jgi:hypothetical protein
MDERMVSKFRRYAELREQKEADAARAKESAKDFSEYEQDLIHELEQSKFKPPYRVDLGPPHGEVRFSPRETHFANVYNPDAVQQYLEERQLVDETTKTDFIAKRLNEHIRDLLEREEPFPEGLDYVTRRGITMTKLNKTS